MVPTIFCVSYISYLPLMMTIIPNEYVTVATGVSKDSREGDDRTLSCRTVPEVERRTDVVVLGKPVNIWERKGRTKGRRDGRTPLAPTTHGPGPRPRARRDG